MLAPGLILRYGHVIDSMKIRQIHEAPCCRDDLERMIKEFEKTHESAIRVAREASGGTIGQ